MLLLLYRLLIALQADAFRVHNFHPCGSHEECPVLTRFTTLRLINDDHKKKKRIIVYITNLNMTQVNKLTNATYSNV